MWLRFYGGMFNCIYNYRVTKKRSFLSNNITSTQRTRICCSSGILNMCYGTAAQPKSLPTKLFNAALIQPDFLSSQKMISEVYTCTAWNLCEDIILHYTRTTWLSLHSYNLISGFYTCTTWNFYLYGKMTYFMLHLHTLIFIIFTKTWLPWLFHSCCVRMFCYIYIFCTYIYV